MHVETFRTKRNTEWSSLKSWKLIGNKNLAGENPPNMSAAKKFGKIL
jgi:hypothetical protein